MILQNRNGRMFPSEEFRLSQSKTVLSPKYLCVWVINAIERNRKFSSNLPIMVRAGSIYWVNDGLKNSVWICAAIWDTRFLFPMLITIFFLLVSLLSESTFSPSFLTVFRLVSLSKLHLKVLYWNRNFPVFWPFPDRVFRTLASTSLERAAQLTRSPNNWGTHARYWTRRELG